MGNAQSPVILRFDEVNFAYNDGKKVILEDVDCTVREDTKITIMGQNGAGKSTMFKMIAGEIKPQSGKIVVAPGKTIAMARQVIPREYMELPLREYFATAFAEKDYQLDKKITEVLEVVNLVAPLDRLIKDFSGGQQARILLAYALIQKPDILLLDEPTNNLDTNGINHLITFLLTYDKTVIVISHDADFLNMFTDGVLYLNVSTRKVEQYRGDYYNVVEEIAAQIEKEKMLNARMDKKMQDAKDKINYFANKGGKMRKIASKLRDEVEEAEENKVVVRRDDRTIGKFAIEFENYIGPIVSLHGLRLMHPSRGTIVHRPLERIIKKGMRYQLVGPNGIGKTTLLKRLVNAHDQDAMIHDDVRVGYYSQDFNALDMNMIVWDALHEMSNEVTDQEVYRTAAQFLLTGDLLKSPISSLSEGQKGLLCYARFVIQKPHLLILDEPTNHINFRHLPVIAESLNEYEGAMIMVSHDQAWVDQLKDVEVIDLGKMIGA